jgi:flagellar biosynthesis/type III secretory pathway ATPase
MTSTINWETYHLALAKASIIVKRGPVTQVIGLAIEAQGLNAKIGKLCYILLKFIVRSGR